jgi:3-hydroxyisobutyrate dehydrogenase/glyoxylate/succinic semialdehyde reductase
MKIGFIDLGIMGSRMAANLQKNGYPLVVFNRTRTKAEPLIGPCGTFSDSPAKLAEQVDVLFTMLAHPDAVEQAALRVPMDFWIIFVQTRFGSIAVR